MISDNTNLQGQVNDLESYLNGLYARVDDLETANNGLQALLSGVTREYILSYDTLRFSGMNVQVVNGTGNTETSNGLGNLIVGYNEIRGSGNIRTGSHYVVIGRRNNYSDYGGIVAGHRNTASGEYASVTGGHINTASGQFSSVSGGQNNTASGFKSSILGGYDIEVDVEFGIYPQ